MNLSSKIIEYKSSKHLRLVVALFLIWYFMSSAFSVEKWHFIDNLDLIIHQAGHLIFLLSGEFVTVIGGSFVQIVIPVAFVIFFIIRKDYYLTSLFLMWLGYNLVNVSIYMADATTMVLPLPGWKPFPSDWNYIFGALHIMNWSKQIAFLVDIVGIIVIITGAVFAVINSGRADTGPMHYAK